MKLPGNLSSFLTSRIFLLALVAAVYLYGFFAFERWRESFFSGDSHGYYLHLVSFFIYDDVGDYSKTIASVKEVYPNYVDPRDDIYGIRKTEKGRFYIKYTTGVSVLETPFFLFAHLIAKVSPKYVANGWSDPYIFLTGLSTIVYILIGLSLLLSILRTYFSRQIAALVVLSVALATNLFYQGTYITMAHGFLFFLYCCLVYLSHHFYKKPDKAKAIFIGVVVGLITIARVPELISGLIPVFWGIASRKDFKARITFFRENYAYLLLALAGFLLVTSLQLTYWHYVSGKLIFNPYQGEGFDFLDPEFYNGFFNFRNGWLIYTPIMGIALIGLLALLKFQKGLFLPVLLFTGLNAYIHYSYYAWTFFPGFGSRVMVETYPLLAFGLAAAFTFLVQSRWTKWLPFFIFIFFAGLNLFQTWQQSAGLLYSENGNKAFYMEMFGRTQSSLNALRAYDSKQLQPDEEDLTLVDTLLWNAFEDTSRFQQTDTLSISGNHSLLVEAETPFVEIIPVGTIQRGDWLEAGVHGYIKPEDRIWNRQLMPWLVVHILDRDGKGKKWSGINIGAHIGKVNYSIWNAGQPGIWNKASFYVKMPKDIQPDWKIKLYIWNPNGQKMYVDDIYLNLYRK